MITVSEYRGQSVGVFGLGKAGSATVASLLAGGAKVFAWDDSFSPSLLEGEGGVGGKTHFSRSALTPPPNLPPQGGEELRHYASWPWTELKALVLAPGVPLSHPAPHPVVSLAKQYHVPVIGDIELLYRAEPKARYVAITGTNGKSTTTALIGHILKEAG
jgi:UDP-N-acetylmuramoylalanine--D-glutamate ligase